MSIRVLIFFTALSVIMPMANVNLQIHILEVLNSYKKQKYFY